MSKKTRVFELAKKLNIPTKELLERLRLIGIECRSHMAGITQEEIDQLTQSLIGKKPTVRPKAKPVETVTEAAAPSRKPARKPSPRDEVRIIEKKEIQTKEGKTTGPSKRPKVTTALQKPAPSARTSKPVSQREIQRPDAITKAEVIPIKPRKLAEVVHLRREKPVAVAPPAPKPPEPIVKPEPPPPPPPPTRTIEIDEAITVEELASKLEIKSNDLILELMDHNVLATKNQALDISVAKRVAEAHACAVRVTTSEEFQALAEEADDAANLQPRAPVVTIMGHVDHGKTSLLDAIRKTNITAEEAGGITQHIGAYDVKLDHGRVVFLDTPGHEAFTAMRARGAQVTDVVVLVVAADDGVKSQTIEAIDHAKAAEVPIVVAINKIDKPGANPDVVKQELSKLDLVPEDWGGKTICVSVSAKTRQGLDQLLEMLILEAELLELKASPQKRARGVVLEAQLDRGRGPVATVLIKNGTLHVGDSFVAGRYAGKVRAMYNDRGENVSAAPPSFPVQVLGLSGVPEAGDLFIVVEDERRARQISESRKMRQREKQLGAVKKITLEDFYQQVQQGTTAELNVILKGDVQGSVEAIRNALGQLSTEEVKLNFIHEGTGGINESDVILAAASNAIIIGFNVLPNLKAQKLAERESVDIRHYQVIYEAIEDVRNAMTGLLKPKYKEAITGHAEIRNVFKTSSFGVVAGCYVLDGEITRGQKARIVRDDTVAHDGRIESLRRFKDDVRSVSSGYECGLKFEDFSDFKVNDIIEAYELIEMEKVL